MEPVSHKSLLAGGLRCIAALAYAADWASGHTEWAGLPEVKRSTVAL